MFEITVIENLDFTVQIAHIPFDDDQVDEAMEWVYRNETKCVERGLINSFTIVSHFEQFNTAANYASPGVLNVHK